MLSDFELLRAWRDGDEESGNELVQRHFATVYRFFAGRVRDAQDLTQRTFLACVQAITAFREEASFRAYVLAIARKQMLMHLRKTYRAGKVFDSTFVSMRELAGDALPSPSAALVQRDQEQLVLLALRELPIDFQLALELFYWEELTMEEIAAVLEVAVGTVKSRLSRARSMLRDKVETLADSEQVRRSTINDLERWAKGLRRDYLGAAESGDSG